MVSSFFKVITYRRLKRSKWSREMGGLGEVTNVRRPSQERRVGEEGRNRKLKQSQTERK